MSPGAATRSKPTVIEHAVYVVTATSTEREGLTMLAELECTDGPAATSIEKTKQNLLAGNAWEQTVAFVVEAETDTPLAAASVCLNGYPRPGGFGPDAYLRSIVGYPHVNMLMRDSRHKNEVLLDEVTPLGSAAVRAGLEVVLRDRPAPRGELPICHALVDGTNGPALEAFARDGFHPHKEEFVPSPSGLFVPGHLVGDVAVVRQAGRLPAGRPASAYRRLLNDACGGENEHPLP
jgi:hypothetical protein